MSIKNQIGFSLIEVLIASLILSISIALVSELYKFSSFSAKKAASKAVLEQSKFILLQSVKSKLRAKASISKLTKIEGQEFLYGHSFNWVADRIKFTARAASVVDQIPPRPQFAIYKVTISNEGNDLEIFTFEVFTW